MYGQDIIRDPGVRAKIRKEINIPRARMLLSPDKDKAPAVGISYIHVGENWLKEFIERPENHRLKARLIYKMMTDRK